ncbi:MAG: RluA family pseudouridine synthase [Clostridia bacterium]|nr:RluA family pseudouridine synthase [Clostridia bacterium]
MNVIYEDNHILVVEKPCNVASQGDETGDKDMLTMCKEYIKEKYNKPGNVYVGLVHRLDRPVGGIMVFAKTSKAASRLSESVRSKDFKKTYLAVVYDKDNKLQDKGEFEDYMIKNEALNKSMVCSKDKHGAKLARLSYEVIGQKDDLKLVRINLETGRHHQIRVQFSSRECPLYGDQKYGSGPKGEQIALWAYKISFKHPIKDDIMEFEDMPKPFGIWKDFI